MFQQALGWTVNTFLEYKFIILFYLLIIAFLLIKRKSVEIQAKIIFLYRTKIGLNFMERVAGKFREWIILFGYIGVGAGYIGLIAISYILIKNLYTLIVQPEATSGVSLVLPGVDVPGLGILPFWYWLIAIFIIAVVHEFSHGIVARANNIEVKNTGLAFFGPIMGAFVEPNEKKLRKEKDIVQYSVLAAGSFSNILLALVALLMLNSLFLPLQDSMVTPTGFTFDQYFNESMPFAQAGIAPGTLITGINDKKVSDFQQFSDELSFYRPGEKVKIKTENKDYTLTLSNNPDNPNKSFLGIQNIRNEFAVKEKYLQGVGNIAYVVVSWLAGLFKWLFLLSFGIGLFNLLPLPIVDGGRMAQVFLHRLKGPVEGEKRYRQIGFFFLIVLIMSFIYPFIIKLLGL